MSTKAHEHMVLEITLAAGLKVEDPYGRFRTEIGYIKPPPGEKEVPVRWLDRGIIVGEGTFIPDGGFTAVMVPRPKKKREKAPEAAAE